MARPLRLHQPEAYYHVLARGNERRAIFRDGADYEHFLELLGAMSERFAVKVLSYVLMGNHYHLLVRPHEEPLSRAMQWLMVSYSIWHNRRHQRSGHLCQGRFKSFLVTEEAYLERLICYVHRNPLRARLVERLAEYPWSSYNALGYGKHVPQWLSRREALDLFAGEGQAFRQSVQRYAEEGASLWEDLREGAYLGSAQGWERLWRKSAPKAHREVPQSRKRPEAMPIEAAVERWCELLGIPQAQRGELLRPVRCRRRPMRELLIWALWAQGRYRLEEIGRCFGIGYTSITMARQRAERHLAENPKVRKALKEGLIDN